MANQIYSLYDDTTVSNTYDADGLDLYLWSGNKSGEIRISNGSPGFLPSGLTVDLDEGYTAYVRPCRECLQDLPLQVKTPPMAFTPSNAGDELGVEVIHVFPNPNMNPMDNVATIEDGTKIGTLIIQQMVTQI